MITKLTTEQKKTLKKIADSGMAKATESMSQMLKACPFRACFGGWPLG